MLRPMDPNVVRALLEGQPDTLSEEVRQDAEVFKNLSCPVCYETGCQKKIRPAKVVIGEDGAPEMLVSPFTPGQALPQGYAHCIHCGTDFDPHSGVISRTEASNIAPVDLDPATTIVFPPPNPHQE